MGPISLAFAIASQSCLPAALDAEQLARRGFAETPIAAKDLAALDTLFSLETGIADLTFRRFVAPSGACFQVARDGCRLKIVCGERGAIEALVGRLGGVAV